MTLSIHATGPQQHPLSQLYGTLEGAAGIGSWQYNFKAKRLIWSKGIYDLLGIPDSSTPSHDLFARFTHPEDRLPIDNLDCYLRDVRSIDREFRIIDTSGAVRWISHKAEVFFDAQGQQLLAAGILIDVSGRVQACREREAAEKQLRAVWHSTAAVTWTTEPNGEKPASQGWTDLTGQSAKESSGLGWLNAVYEPDRKATRDAWLKAYASKTRYAAKYRLIGYDGKLRWFLAQAVPVIDANGNVEHWLGSLIDIEVLENPQKPGVDFDDFAGFNGAVMTAARALLGWSLNDLANYSGVSISTIRRVEESERMSAKRPIMLKLLSALGDGGVEFQRHGDGWFVRQSPQRQPMPMPQQTAPAQSLRVCAR